MPRYTRVYSVIRVVGRLWMPGVKAAQDVAVDARDLEQLKDGRPLAQVTREDVAAWLATHTGNFSEVIDFQAELSEGEDDVTLGWADEESEWTYNDCMFPADD